MLIGGLQKLSLLDYPDKIAAIIFTAGCNFRCPYCHNPELVNKINKDNLWTEKQIFDFLKRRHGKLEAVVITGGEPTLHKDLPEFIEKIKKMDYLVKLDTNGTNPAMLEKLIKNKNIDYLAMDIKAPLEKYSLVVRQPVNIKHIQKSIKLIMQSGIDYEFRSTIVPKLHSPHDVEAMAELIHGAKKYYLQNFIASGNLIDENFNDLSGFKRREINKLVELCRPHVEYCAAR